MSLVRKKALAKLQPAKLEQRNHWFLKKLARRSQIFQKKTIEKMIRGHDRVNWASVLAASELQR